VGNKLFGMVEIPGEAEIPCRLLEEVINKYEKPQL
jgi:hypothetical protein